MRGLRADHARHPTASISLNLTHTTMVQHRTGSALKGIPASNCWLPVKPYQSYGVERTTQRNRFVTSRSQVKPNGLLEKKVPSSPNRSQNRGTEKIEDRAG
jgi:hypothetical protein